MYYILFLYKILKPAKLLHTHTHTYNGYMCMQLANNNTENDKH